MSLPLVHHVNRQVDGVHCVDSRQASYQQSDRIVLPMSGNINEKNTYNDGSCQYGTAHSSGRIPLKQLPQATNVSDDLMTRGQVAAMLQCSIRTLERLAIDGDGPTYYRVGRSVRYRSIDIERCG
jgi:hypothetical protein